MIDPVTRELESRAVQGWPWRLALALSLGLHLAAGFGLLLAGTSSRRSTTLPSVQVRLTTMPLPAPAPAPARPSGSARPAVAPAAPRPAPPPAEGAGRTVSQAARTPMARPTAAAHPPESAPAAAADSDAATAPATAPMSSSSGALTLGGGSRGGGTDETFPYEYYLQRLLGLIENNWFRPAAPETTRCRVRARIDRSGRLLEAGISQESGISAFDRAALRAVFAAAPFPPLPQGFGGTTLTIHLEFGQ